MNELIKRDGVVIFGFIRVLWLKVKVIFVCFDS